MYRVLARLCAPVLILASVVAPLSTANAASTDIATIEQTTSTLTATEPHTHTHSGPHTHAGETGAAQSAEEVLANAPDWFHFDNVPAGAELEPLPEIDMSRWMGVPVLRERADGGPAQPALDVLDFRSWNLTPATMAAAGFDTLVPFADLSSWTQDMIKAGAVPSAELEKFLTGHRAAQASSASIGAAALQYMAISVRYDSSIATHTNSAFVRNVADTAWSQTVTFYNEKHNIGIDRIHFVQDDGTVPPVDTVCKVQRAAEQESNHTPRGVGLVLFTGSTISGAYGFALDYPAARPYSRGESEVNWCSGDNPAHLKDKPTPSILPAMFASTALAVPGQQGEPLFPSWDTDKTGTAYVTAHEFAHFLGMQHDMGRCWNDLPWHTHKTLEVFTSDYTGSSSQSSNPAPANCGANYNPSGHFHWYLNDQAAGGQPQGGWGKVNSERDRLAGCLPWCPTDATPSAVRSLSASAGNGQVTLNWVAPQYLANTVQGYCVYVATATPFYKDKADHCYSGAATTSVTISSYRANGVDPFVPLTNGQTYHFYVRAYNSNGSNPVDRDGPRSNYASATPAVPPCTPTAPTSPFTNTPTASTLTLGWLVPSQCSIAGYRVWRSTSPTSDGSVVTSGGCASLVTSTTCTDSGLAAGTTYYYKVQARSTAVEGSRDGALSTQFQGTTSTAPCTPNAPGTPTVGSPTTSSLGLSWGASANCSVQYYKVYRSTSSGSDGSEVPSTSTCYRRTTTSCTDSGLASGTTYYYKVSAVSSAGQSGLEGAKSGQGSGTTSTASCTPAAPGGPSTSGATSSSLNLAWSGSTNCGVQYYKVYRSTSSGSDGSEVPSTSTCYRRTTTSCTDSGLASGTTYYYKVSAVSTAAQGGLEGAKSTQGSGATTAAANDCGTGGDAGNTTSTATTITLPKTNCTGSLTSGDDDFYKFAVTSGQTINASMTPNSSADFDICLYDPSGNSVGSCTTGSVGSTDSINQPANVTGNWMLRVMIWSGTGSYTLSVSTTTSGGGSTPTPNPADAPRLIGNESWVFQMDSDDHNQPSTGKARDSAPGAKHANVNSASLTTFSKFGHAYSFAGANQSISVPETGAMASGTVMMWVYPTVSGARLMFKQNPGVSNELALNIGADNKVYFQTNQNAPTLASTSTVPLNQWTHIAVTWGSSGKRIYLNGSAAGSDGDTAGVGTAYTQTMLGNSPNDLSTGGFNGAMDEAREYTVALSQSDIQSLKDLPYVGTGGPSSNPAHSPRLLGNELFAYQMDSDDHNLPSSGQTRDSSTSLAHGTLSGVATTTSGRFGSGYSFSGVNNYIRVPQSGVARPSGTIMMWVYPTSLSSGGPLFYHQQPGVANELVLGLDTTGRIYFQTTNDGSKGFMSTSTLPLNQWSHVAVTWGSSGQQIYVNGSAAGSGTNTAGVGSGYSHTMIGNSPNDTGTGGFNGRLDEVREYSVALSQSNIQSIKDLPYTS